VDEVQVVSVNSRLKRATVRVGNVFLEFVYRPQKRKLEVVGRYKHAQQHDKEALWVPENLFREAQKKALEALSAKNPNQLKLNF